MRKIGDLVMTVAKTLVIVLFVAMTCLVFAQVYTRFVTNNSLTWSEELSRFIMIWMVFIGAAITYRENAHIYVDNVVNFLPENVRKFVHNLSLISQFIFLGIVVWGAYIVLPTTFMQNSPANGITMAYVYAAIPISSILMIIMLIEKILPSAKEKEGNEV